MLSSFRNVFRLVCLAGCFLSPLAMSAQNRDTVHALEGIHIETEDKKSNTNALSPIQSVDNEHLTQLPALQVSDVLKLFSGIVIRDYGGVGGMKTVAVRGFGSQHTAVSYDESLIADGQTGQIDLSRFSLQGLYDIELVTGPTGAELVPARHSSAAGTLIIRSPQPHFSSNKPVNLHFQLSGGSFGLVNPFLRIENRIKEKSGAHPYQVSSSLSVNYLHSKGNYPYTIHFGGINDSTAQCIRQNSDIQSITLEENLFFNFYKKGNLQAKVYYYQSERGLPGAVIFYTTRKGQRLYDQNVFAQVHYDNQFNEKWSYRCNAKFNFAGQRYYDSSYLNSAGFIDNRYFQREYYLSNAVAFSPHRIVSLALANDLIFSNMSANLTDFVRPSRFQSLTALTATLSHRIVRFQARLLHTGVADRTARQPAKRLTNRFTPAVSFSVQPFSAKNWHIRAFYQNIFRLPTFNDLYYNEVGNNDLKPENAHQFNVGTTFAHSFKQQSSSRKNPSVETSGNGSLRHNILLEFSADAFYNIVTNKIVAIPNKNLFVWSMLNFGKVEMRGSDLMVQLAYQVEHPVFNGFSFTANYSFQRAVDRTDAGTKTFGHQIPYTPRHSGSLTTMLKFKWFQLCYTLSAVGKRYALQQNVAANELSPYADHNLSVTTEWPISYKIKKNSVNEQLTIGGKAEILNIADQNYEVIRYYPMQGRSFRLAVWLKF